MHGFLLTAKLMAPLLVLMLCPVWLPMIGMLVGKIYDAITGKG